MDEKIDQFCKRLQKKVTEANRAVWLLETTGSLDALELSSSLSSEVKELLSSREIFSALHGKKGRFYEVLSLQMMGNQVSPLLLSEIAEKEAKLSHLYCSFRPQFEGKEISENEIRDVLKGEKEEERRKRVFEASKEIGVAMAPGILELVHLRNRVAKELSFPDFFSLQLHLQEVDEKWLFAFLGDYAKATEAPTKKLLGELKAKLGGLSPWHFADPFGQEDPLDVALLDQIVEGSDPVALAKKFYGAMGLSIEPILERSDLYERKGKSQHAFCIHIDRMGDIRTLNNLNHTIKWLEVLFHELGHAVYEEGFDGALPWLLREPPHMITTEAMALLMGRQVYREESLSFLFGRRDPLFSLAEKSISRRQLLFGRWALVMTYFEKELYQNPGQDLNALWWSLVAKFQGITPPKRPPHAADWAAKYHIALSPVYYYSYLLGDIFSLSLEEKFSPLHTEEAACALREKLFFPGNRLRWDQLVYEMLGKPLSAHVEKG